MGINEGGMVNGVLSRKVEITLNSAVSLVQTVQPLLFIPCYMIVAVSLHKVATLMGCESKVVRLTFPKSKPQFHITVGCMSSGTYIEPLNYAQTLTCHFLYTLLAVVQI